MAHRSAYLFCGAHDCDQKTETDRHTDHATSATISRLYGMFSYCAAVGGSSPSCWGRGQTSYRVRSQGGSPRTKVPRGSVWFLGRGSQLRGLGERNAACSPSGIQGGAPAAVKLSCILEAPDGLSWNLSAAKFGGRGMAPLALSLKSAYVCGYDFHSNDDMNYCLQCFDAVGWALGRASGL